MLMQKQIFNSEIILNKNSIKQTSKLFYCKFAIKKLEAFSAISES